MGGGDTGRERERGRIRERFDRRRGEKGHPKRLLKRGGGEEA